MESLNEIWKDIPDYEGLYQVSNLGRVKSLRRKIKTGIGTFIKKQRILSLYKNGRYYKTNLFKNNKSKIYRVHQLVAMAFLGHKPCGYYLVVDHIDNNPLNNNVSNLQLITPRENCTKDKKRMFSNYVGAYWQSDNKNWVSRIKINKKIIHLGVFKKEYDAHLAYQKKLNEIKKATY